MGIIETLCIADEDLRRILECMTEYLLGLPAEHRAVVDRLDGFIEELYEALGNF